MGRQEMVGRKPGRGQRCPNFPEGMEQTVASVPLLLGQREAASSEVWFCRSL